MRVSIDLETTGLHPEQDAVIEIGAVKFAGDEVLETFEMLISPGIPLPYRIQRLTGIAPAQLRGAPSLVSVLPSLRAFLGDVPLVGHNIPFDVGFLRRVGLARRNPQIDTYELASALLPGLKTYTLASVASALEVPGETHHRALADAQLARQILLALLLRMERLDTGIIEALEALPAPQDWTLRYFLRQQVRARQTPLSSTANFGGLLTTSLGEQLMSKLEVNPEVLTLAVAGQDRVPQTSRVPAEVSALPEPQVVESVSACLSEGGVLLLEAADLPHHELAITEAAVRWSATTGEQVLLVAAEGARMRRLASETLPQALARADITPGTLPIAEVAEREAYLCLHRWFGAARVSHDGPLTREATHGLAKIIGWVRDTRTGLRAELALPGLEAQAWDLVRSGPEFASGMDACPYRRDGYCFTDRAEHDAMAAQIIVTTHAALAARLSGTDTTLPDVARVVVLDSPSFDEEVRRAASATLDHELLLATLRRLAVSEVDGRHAGLLHAAASRQGLGSNQNRERSWFEQVTSAEHALESFFAALRTLLTESAGHTGSASKGGGASDPRLLPLDDRAWQLSTWGAVKSTWTHLERRLTAVAKLARETAQSIHSAWAGKRPIATDGLAVELLAIASTLERSAYEGTCALEESQRTNEARWLRVPYPQHADGSAASAASAAHDQHAHHGGRNERGGPRVHARGSDAHGDETEKVSEAPEESALPPVLHRAPVHVGALVSPLSAPGRALVLAGPALAVGGEFEHMRGTFGLPETTRGLSIAPDCEEQTLLGLPNDVPEPNAPHYQRALEELLIKLGTELGGRIVALFPSHAALRAAYAGIRRTLERQDVLVLAQGQDGSARQIWHTFNTQPRTILLGAGGFWSGQDQGDRAPACVLVARLPFPALSDPLQAARSALWDDPQVQYVVPQAALKLRQALNGLAWSHHQRNAVVLFDKRIQTRSYGQTILGTLPRCTQHQEPAAQLAERIAEWVGE
jgi:DNA polymerase III epsilon subunit family exonuclease